MTALLASPLARWAALAGLLAAVALWGWTERAGRQVAVLEAAAAERRAVSAEARIRNMEARNEVDDAVRRERAPAERLRDEWSRD